jgi:proteasome lid subunit RPN8/RPN11
MGRIGYVGEWHSHPRGATLQPSADDLEAYSWLIIHMQKEALPAIMVIAGDDSQFRLVRHEHD